MALYQTRDGKSPHIKWLELKKDGIMHECAVMKKDEHGNVYYFELGKIDLIDKQRIARILMNRNADRMELWDLMSSTTLNNGVNALTYFHQLVKIISPDGIIYSPAGGVVGTARRSGEIALDAKADPVERMEKTEESIHTANPTVTENK